MSCGVALRLLLSEQQLPAVLWSSYKLMQASYAACCAYIACCMFYGIVMLLMAVKYLCILLTVIQFHHYLVALYACYCSFVENVLPYVRLFFIRISIYHIAPPEVWQEVIAIVGHAECEHVIAASWR